MVVTVLGVVLGGLEDCAAAGVPMWMLLAGSSKGGAGCFDMMEVAPSKKGCCFVV